MTLLSSPYILAIHTASPDLGLAIGNISGERRSRTWVGLGREMSTQLHPYLSEFVHPQTWTDLACIAVAKGPGGFTGTRLGVVTARTLAQQLNIPLFAISTLAIVAWNGYFNHPHPDEADNAVIDIAVQMAAQRGELHTAIYSIATSHIGPDAEAATIAPQLIVKLPDSVMTSGQWQQRLDQWQNPCRLIQVGDGLGDMASSLLEFALLEWKRGIRPHWSEALPFYGQSPV